VGSFALAFFSASFAYGGVNGALSMIEEIKERD
jgi:hypothetical protein